MDSMLYDPLTQPGVGISRIRRWFCGVCAPGRVFSIKGAVKVRFWRILPQKCGHCASVSSLGLRANAGVCYTTIVRQNTS